MLVAPASRQKFLRKLTESLQCRKLLVVANAIAMGLTRTKQSAPPPERTSSERVKGDDGPARSLQGTPLWLCGGQRELAQFGKIILTNEMISNFLQVAAAEAI